MKCAASENSDAAPLLSRAKFEEMTTENNTAWIDDIEQGAYIAALLKLETIWFRERDDFHKGLIRMCAGLNQLRLGLDSGPRFLLSSARALLQPFQPRQAGIDLLALDHVLVACLQLIEDFPGQPRTPPPMALRPAESQQ